MALQPVVKGQPNKTSTVGALDLKSNAEAPTVSETSSDNQTPVVETVTVNTAALSSEPVSAEQVYFTDAGKNKAIADALEGLKDLNALTPEKLASHHQTIYNSVIMALSGSANDCKIFLGPFTAFISENRAPETAVFSHKRLMSGIPKLKNMTAAKSQQYESILYLLYMLANLSTRQANLKQTNWGRYEHLIDNATILSNLQMFFNV